MTTALLSRTRNSVPWLALVSLETFAQISLKLAADVTDISKDIVPWLQSLASNHWFQVSIACDIAGFLSWMAILRRYDLGVAIPISSLCYFATVAMSTLYLHEPVHGIQLVGLAVIGAGVILVATE